MYALLKTSQPAANNHKKEKYMGESIGIWKKVDQIFLYLYIATNIIPSFSMIIVDNMLQLKHKKSKKICNLDLASCRNLFTRERERERERERDKQRERERKRRERVRKRR